MSDVKTDISVNGEGTLIVKRSQDVDPILRQARELAKDNRGKSESGEMYHAARIPMVMVETYCNTKGITFHEFMANPAHTRAMLNDPALSKFRIWEGRV